MDHCYADDTLMSQSERCLLLLLCCDDDDNDSVNGACISDAFDNHVHISE